MDASVQKPDQSSYLPNYSTQTKYIQSHGGNCVYLRYKAAGGTDEKRRVDEAEKVTVYAYQDGSALIQTADGRMGWVTDYFLVDSYSPYYQKLSDGYYLASINLGAINKPGGVFYVATVEVEYAEGDREINKGYRLRISDSVEIYDEDGYYYSSIREFINDNSSKTIIATIQSLDGKIVYIDAGYDW